MKLLVLLSCLVLSVHGALRYTEQSCTDLVPRNQENFHDELRARKNGRFKRKRHDFESDVPFKVLVPGRRYRRNSDLTGKLWKNHNFG